MRVINFLIIMTLVFLLSACGLTPEARALRAEQQRREQLAKIEAERQQEARRKAAIENQCKAYGFAQGTTPYSQCLMKIDAAQQAAAARQAEIAQQRAQLESQCSMIRAQAWQAPTQTGSFFEGLNNSNAAYNNCMAGLPPPPQRLNVICNKQGLDQIYCFSQ